LVYVKDSAPRREPRLRSLLERIQDDDRASYKRFSSPRELAQLVGRDLAVLLSERFAARRVEPMGPASAPEVWQSQWLPAAVSSFVGRDRELGDLTMLVANHRLVTVVGPGGAGKTRLAVEAARRLRSGFSGRVALVELAGVAAGAESQAVPRTVADGLGLVELASDEPAADATALLVRALRRRRTLLVLDNCEHVLDEAAELVARLSADCPRLHVLATSREPLAVPGERQVPVAPLDLEAAVQLFTDRAAAVRAGFALTDDGRPAVEEICRRLDDLPLAIELAAARVKVLPPAEIARRLDDRFRLLRTGSRTVAARQQTLEALVDWSYELLSESERHVFARLGVFAGGIPLDGAEAVCSAGDLDPSDVLDLVGRLVDKSLVQSDYDEGGSPRFRMLETLRAYAFDRLGHTEQEDSSRRHAAYIGEIAEAAWVGLRGPNQAEWLRRLSTENDNVRAALGWAVSRDATLAQRIAGHIGWFWWMSDHAAEGESWLRAALGAPGPAARAFSTRSRVMLALLMRGRVGEATEETAAREALSDATEVGGELLALARVILAAALGRRGEFDDAFALLDLAEADGTEWIRATTDVVRATLLAITDRAALQIVAARAVDRFTAVGDRVGEVDARTLLAVEAWRRGDTSSAHLQLERALQISRELGVASHEALIITHIADLAVTSGDLDRAEELLEQTVATFTRVGSPGGAAAARRSLAAVAAKRGDLPRARAIYQDLLTDLRDSGRLDTVATILARLGFLAARAGDLREAHARHRESLEIAARIRVPASIARALDGLAGVSAAVGDGDRAARLLGGADALRAQTGVPVNDVDRDDVQRAVDGARAALGPAAFDVTHTDGRSLSLPTLLDLARDLEPPPEPTGACPTAY
jgi:predicted ATPase